MSVFPCPLLIPNSPLKEVILREYFIKINRDLEFPTFTQRQQKRPLWSAKRHHWYFQDHFNKLYIQHWNFGSKEHGSKELEDKYSFL